MAISRDTALRRLRACGIPRGPATEILSLFEKWVSSSGPEWTVQHMKVLKVDLLRHISGLEPVGTWIKRRKDGVTPAGPMGYLWKISTRNKKWAYSAWNVIMIYTSLVFPASDLLMTSQQLEKFSSAVVRAQPPEKAIRKAESIMVDSGYRFTRRFTASTGSDVLGVTHSPSKRAPIPGDVRTYPVDATLIGALAALRWSPDFYWRHAQILDGAMGPLKSFLGIKGGPSEQDRNLVRDTYIGMWSTTQGAENITPLISGRVGFKQDAGYKLRHIAVPNQILQAALRPLGRFLLNNLRDIPEDVTFNQEQGVLDVQAMLAQGRTAYSFDLSSATDRFPASLQYTMLRWLGIDEDWVSLFAEVSRGLWQWTSTRRMPKGILDGPYGMAASGHVAWTVGQPLGLYPSFAAFTLCHHMVVRGLFRSFGREQFAYRILGDDIVIFDHEVAQAYQALLSELGVEISEAKSIASEHVAEFAGKIIFPDWILTGYKWSGICSDFNFLDVVKNLGYRGRYLLRLRQRKVFDAIASIPEPWGLGFNPLGLPLSERLGPHWEALARDRDTRPRAYSTQSRRMWNIFYSTHPAFYRLSDEIPVGTSDQEVFALLSNTVGPRVAPLGHVMLPNLDYLTRLAADDGVIGDLASSWQDVQPFLSKLSFLERVQRVSTLVKYERLLFEAHKTKS